MSWSLTLVGTPDKFPKAFDDFSAGLTGDSKAEFDAARPALETLVGLNVNKATPQAVRLSANGHAYKNNGELAYSSCSVDLKPLDGKVL